METIRCFYWSYRVSVPQPSRELVPLKNSLVNSFKAVFHHGYEVNLLLLLFPQGNVEYLLKWKGWPPKWVSAVSPGRRSHSNTWPFTESWTSQRCLFVCFLLSQSFSKNQRQFLIVTFPRHPSCTSCTDTFGFENIWNSYLIFNAKRKQFDWNRVLSFCFLHIVSIRITATISFQVQTRSFVQGGLCICLDWDDCSKLTVVMRTV